MECLGKTAVDGVESVHPGNFVVVEEKMLARHHKFKMMVEPSGTLELFLSCWLIEKS